MAFGLFDEGLVLPRAADFLESIAGAYAERTGERPDWDRDEVLGALRAVVALELDELSQFIQSIYDAWDENNATGVQLENIAAMFPGISRKVPTRSVVELSISGDPNTIIPSGFLVQGGGTDGLARWALRDTTQIPPSGALDGVVAEAVETGPIQASAGEITKIVNLVDGWDAATNPDIATPGLDRETDDALRKRRRESLQIVGGRSLGAILGNVKALPFIGDGFAVENTDSATQTVQGITLPPHSLAIVVLPSTLTTDQEETLAKTIYNLVPVGIEVFGTESATVLGADGLSKDVAWNYPVEILVTTQWAIRPEPGFAFSTLSAGVQQATVDFFGQLGIGEPVRILAMIRFVTDAVPGIQKLVLTLNLGLADIETAANEIAVFSSPGSIVIPG
jgi:hypothetical protein